MFLKLKKIFQSFSRKERIFFIVALALFLISAIILFANFIQEKTVALPIEGGEFTEGLTSQPIFINPVLANSDADRDLTELLFEDVLSLSDSYKFEDDGKVIRIRLKDNLHWSDGQPLTSDDVIFTIDTIQGLGTQSLLYSAFSGITAQRVSERELTLTLPVPYSFFESTLQELRPIPKHVFADIPATNLKLSNYNLEPVGSGPFKYVSYKKQKDGFIVSYHLTQNKYAVKKPYLKNFNLNFYADEEKAKDAFNSGLINGLAGISSTTLNEISVPHQTFRVNLPKYYAIFLNQNANGALKNSNVRIALNYATDRKTIIDKVFGGMATEVVGPLTPTMEGFNPNLIDQNFFSLDKANEILEKDGWKLNSDGIREKTSGKNKTLLELNLIAPENPLFAGTANLLIENWQKIGVKINLIKLPSLEDAVKTRDYQMILFGNIFGRNPDPFSFWHSSERFYPGLNLSLYENKSVDALIEKIRQNFDVQSRLIDWKNFQTIISNDQPAIFLLSPNYLYIASKNLKGFEEQNIPVPNARFDNVDKWYLKTIRVFK
ncbi:MAG: peptide ABC transporter substrate-binding protein [Candidatus Paceibacterota bacterium]